MWAGWRALWRVKAHRGSCSVVERPECRCRTSEPGRLLPPSPVGAADRAVVPDCPVTQVWAVEDCIEAWWRDFEAEDSIWSEDDSGPVAYLRRRDGLEAAQSNSDAARSKAAPREHAVSAECRVEAALAMYRRRSRVGY